MIFMGIDLAWGQGQADKKTKESGVILLNTNGDIADAGWTVGIRETIDWIESNAHKDTLLFVDAPLVVNNESGQRYCEKQVGQRYGRWKVSANSTHKHSKSLAGVALREELGNLGWRYSDGCSGSPGNGRYLSECYPYTTIVGAYELGYVDERPVYKRRPKKMKLAEFRPYRAQQCDELIYRIGKLSSAVPPMNLASHPETTRLQEEASPIADREYKHREDLLDAALCAWTASLWFHLGKQRCQVLGCNDPLSESLRSTIIAPARTEQRREPDS